MKRQEITACHMPSTCDDGEAGLYRKILAAHCARKDEPNHECRGTVAINRKALTLSCPLCGDARKVIP